MTCLFSSAVPKRSRLQSPPRRASKRWLRCISSSMYASCPNSTTKYYRRMSNLLSIHVEAKNVQILDCNEGNMWVSKISCEGLPSKTRLFVNYIWIFLVLLGRNPHLSLQVSTGLGMGAGPHLFKGIETSQYRPSNPG